MASLKTAPPKELSSLGGALCFKRAFSHDESMTAASLKFYQTTSVREDLQALFDEAQMLSDQQRAQFNISPEKVDGDIGIGQIGDWIKRTEPDRFDKPDLGELFCFYNHYPLGSIETLINVLRFSRVENPQEALSNFKTFKALEVMYVLRLLYNVGSSVGVNGGDQTCEALLKQALDEHPQECGQRIEADARRTVTEVLRDFPEKLITYDLSEFKENEYALLYANGSAEEIASSLEWLNFSQGLTFMHLLKFNLVGKNSRSWVFKPSDLCFKKFNFREGYVQKIVSARKDLESNHKLLNVFVSNLMGGNFSPEAYHMDENDYAQRMNAAHALAARSINKLN